MGLHCNFAAALRQNENTESSCYSFDHEDGERELDHEDDREDGIFCFAGKHTVSLLVR